MKKGEYKIRDFTASNNIIAYTDAIDTQLFHFDPETLKLKKLTTQICHSNDLQRLPPSQHLQFDSNNNLVMALHDGTVLKVDLETKKVEKLLSESVYKQTKTKMRLYDRIILQMCVNSDTE